MHRVILVDSIVSKQVECGAVVVFDKQELGALSKNYYPHGMNIPEVIATGERFGISLPAVMMLIGIEVEDIAEFGEQLSEVLSRKFDSIYQNISTIIRKLLTN